MSKCTIPSIDWAKEFPTPPGVEGQNEPVIQSNEMIDRMKKEILSSLEGKQLTIFLDWDKDWKGAFCKELLLSGFGGTIDEALASLATSINSTFRILKRPFSEKKDEANATMSPSERAIKEVLSSPPTGEQTHRFHDLLKRKGLVFASGNGLSLDELCDFIEKTTPDAEGETNVKS